MRRTPVIAAARDGIVREGELRARVPHAPAPGVPVALVREPRGGHTLLLPDPLAAPLSALAHKAIRKVQKVGTRAPGTR